jgi:hypothetical protein
LRNKDSFIIIFTLILRDKNIFPKRRFQDLNRQFFRASCSNYRYHKNAWYFLKHQILKCQMWRLHMDHKFCVRNYKESPEDRTEYSCRNIEYLTQQTMSNVLFVQRNHWSSCILKNLLSSFFRNILFQLHLILCYFHSSRGNVLQAHKTK